jgi:hypothetical protein
LEALLAKVKRCEVKAQKRDTVEVTVGGNQLACGLNEGALEFGASGSPQRFERGNLTFRVAAHSIGRDPAFRGCRVRAADFPGG